jgi:hypothetical protein
MTQPIQPKRAGHSQGDVDLQEVNAWAVGLEAIHTRISRYFIWIQQVIKNWERPTYLSLFSETLSDLIQPHGPYCRECPPASTIDRA